MGILRVNGALGADEGGALLRINDPGLMQSDLILLGVMSEDPRYLKRWGSVLASGAKRVTTMATDCHRNTFKQLMQDGERVDSYRRIRHLA